MKVPYSYLKEQFQDPGPILRALRDQLDRCEFTFGPELEEFEKNMARYTGSKYCLGTASGTTALSMLLKAAGVGDGRGGHHRLPDLRRHHRLDRRRRRPTLLCRCSRRLLDGSSPDRGGDHR